MCLFWLDYSPFNLMVLLHLQNLVVQAESRLLLSTQANSRVFRSDNGRVAEQLIEGRLEKSTGGVFFSIRLNPTKRAVLCKSNLKPGLLSLRAIGMRRLDLDPLP